MIQKIIKNITTTAPEVYVACVRRTASQFQTIDVEIISDKFDINTPNENYFIYGVRLQGIVLLYTQNNVINRPKINSYVVVAKTDNNNWWTVISNNNENFLIQSQDIHINIGNTVIINNVDIFKVKNILAMGKFDETYDEVSITYKHILLTVPSRSYIDISNNILFNALNNKFFIGQSTYIKPNNSSLDALKQIQKENKNIFLQRYVGNVMLIDHFNYKIFFLNYLLWYVNNYDDFEVNQRKVNLWLNQVTLDGLQSFYNELTVVRTRNVNELLISQGYSEKKTIQLKNYFLNYDYITLFDSLLAPDVAKKTTLETIYNTYHRKLIVWHKIYYTVTLSPLFQQTIRSNNRTTTVGQIQELFKNYILRTIQIQSVLDEFQHIYSLYSTHNDMTVYDYGADNIIKDQSLMLNDIILYETGISPTSQNTTNFNLGQILNDMITTLKGYNILITNTSIPLTASGYVIQNYYLDTETKNNSLLRLEN